MDKLDEIDQFMKFLPKINVEDEDTPKQNKVFQQNKQGNKNNQSRSNSKNPSSGKNAAVDIKASDKKLSIKEINQKLKDKMKNFNVNSAKNNKNKKPRRSFNKPEKTGKGEKAEKSAKSVNKNNNLNK